MLISALTGISFRRDDLWPYDVQGDRCHGDYSSSGTPEGQSTSSKSAAQEQYFQSTPDTPYIVTESAYERQSITEGEEQGVELPENVHFEVIRSIFTYKSFPEAKGQVSEP